MNNTKELVFIDESLVELDVLLKSISNKTIFLLNHKTPLLSQMAQKLKDNKDIKAIHIITHGNSGELLLGDYVVSTTTLPLYSKEILTISDTMLEDGEIFLYGCEVAYGKKGEEFVTAFADYTNKKVAASSHKVGHQDLGGSWDLNFGMLMDSNILEIKEWRGLLIDIDTPFELNLTNAKQWYRPDPGSSIAGDLTYGVFDQIAPQSNLLYNYAFSKFSPTVTGQYDFKLTNTALNDSMIFVYGQDFSLSNNTPSGTFIVGDDDSADSFFPLEPGDSQSYWSGLENINLTAGQTYYFIMSSYGQGDTGAVNFIISGPGSIALLDGTYTKQLTYSSITFDEAVANDGTISTAITISLEGDTFTGANDAVLAGVTVNNVPAGLTAVVTKKTDTTAEITFTGNATSHVNADDISNLEVVFGNGAFTGGNASVVTNATKSNLVVDFDDPAPSSGGGSTPVTPPPTVIDGATVQTGTTTETRTTTDSNGNTITTTVTTEQLVISPVGDNRTDSTGTATTADIPLFWGESSRTEWATTASLPTGFGLTTSGSRAPSQTATQQSVLADLIYYIDTTAPSTDLNKTQMLSGGSSFLSALGNIETLVVNKVTLTSSTTLASNTPITISGSASGIVTTTGTQAPQEALVIDASSLPINTIIELENVEFAVIVGNVTIRGGDGQNTLFSGDGSQDIMLGADDDELHAGAGDDKVGSAGGNDKIFGESGNDTVFGGEGNDMLHGGSDIDVATYSGNISDYVITRDESKTYVALASNSQEKDTLINVESIKFADTNYVIETTVNQSQIATLYMQVLDRQAEIDGYQYWAYSGNELGAMAINFVKSEEYKIKSGVNWDSLNIEDKIETLYEAILGRNSDAQGKQNWIDYYNSGATIEQVAEGFVNSIELSGIYQNKEDWNFTL